MHFWQVFAWRHGRVITVDVRWSKQTAHLSLRASAEVEFPGDDVYIDLVVINEANSVNPFSSAS